MIGGSDNAGDARDERGVEGGNVSGDGVERRVRERKGRISDDMDTGDALRHPGDTGEGETGLGLAFSERELVEGEAVGGSGSFSEVIKTAGGDGGMGNIASEGSKRVEGVKRTP